MKKLFRTLAIITLFKLLLLPAFSSQCLAAVSAGVTTDMISNDKPVVGVLGIEMGPARFTAGAGYNERAEGAFDLLARTKSGLYFGVGIYSERATDYTEIVVSDTLTTPQHGKGKGLVHKKKSRRGGKVVTNFAFPFESEDYAAYPSLLMGLAGKHIYFENRIIFGTTDTASGQASIGLRW